MFICTVSLSNKETLSKCFAREGNFLVWPFGSVGKRKYNLNGISTAFRRHFR